MTVVSSFIRALSAAQQDNGALPLLSLCAIGGVKVECIRIFPVRVTAAAQHSGATALRGRSNVPGFNATSVTLV